MFSILHKKKASGIIKATQPARVYRELPVMPVMNQSSMHVQWDRAALENIARPEPQVSAQRLSPRSGAPLSRNMSQQGFIMEFSDGQRIPVSARCGAGRMPVNVRDGYNAFALLHDPSQQISRRHFEFGVTSVGQVWVMDCDSSNGTWLESHGSRTQLPKLSRVSMAAGDVLRFGNMYARLVRMR